MVDPPLPNDRPVYWADCERMNLPELERFLREAESHLTDGTIPDDGSMPRTRQRLKKELGIE